MKKIWVVLISALFVLLNGMSCDAQVKSQYEIGTAPVEGATQYRFFAEKKSTNPYRLVEGMDYVEGKVSNLMLAVSSTPVFVATFDNDGSEYVVGIVAEDAAGYYSAMGTAKGNVGNIPNKPAGVYFRKR